MSSSVDSIPLSEPVGVGRDDVMIQFPKGRHPKLPAMYIKKDHPQHVGRGTAYYFVHNASMSASKEIYELEVNELKIPQGPREDAISLGFLELFPGDIVFSRLASHPSTGVKDVPVVWATGRGIYSAALMQKALNSRDNVLGDRSERSRSHATPDPLTGVMTGGTRWERSLNSTFNKERGRCYAFSCTFQRQRLLYSPCAAGKLSVASSDDLKMRSDLAEATLEMAMISLKQGPKAIVDAIQLNHELVNTPRVGSAENFAFTSNQLNLAHVREWESAESLADNMGQKFGGAHIDQLDSPGHFTNMVALSDLPPGCDPGRFYIVYPGIFCTLHNFVSVNFSGLRVHGGSPPIASENATEYKNKWSTRCVVVGYSKIGPTSTERKMPLLELEPNSVLSITPEMMRPGRFALTKKLNATNFIMEGPTMMTPSVFMEFIGRCLLLLILAIISKLPSSMKVKVDSDAFLGSVTYTDENDVRRRIGPWINGPGWREGGAVTCAAADTLVDDDHLVSQDAHLELQREKWRVHENICGGHIPSAVCCLPKITPLEGWEEGQPLDKIKPLLFAKNKNEEKETVPPSPPPKQRKARKPKGSKKEGKGKAKSSRNDADDSSKLVPRSEESDPVPVLRLEHLINSKGQVVSKPFPHLVSSFNKPEPVNHHSSAGSKVATSSKSISVDGGRPLLVPNKIVGPVVPSNLDVLSIAKASGRKQSDSNEGGRKALSTHSVGGISAALDPLVVDTSSSSLANARQVIAPNLLSTSKSGSDAPTHPPLESGVLPVGDVSSLDVGVSRTRSLSDIFGDYVMRHNDEPAPYDVNSVPLIAIMQGDLDDTFSYAETDQIDNSGSQRDTPLCHRLGLGRTVPASAGRGPDCMQMSAEASGSSISSSSLGKRERSNDSDNTGDSLQTSADTGVETPEVAHRNKRRQISNDVLEETSELPSSGSSVSAFSMMETEDDTARLRPLSLDDLWNNDMHHRIQFETIDCRLQFSVPITYSEESDHLSNIPEPEYPLDMPLSEEISNLRELPRYLHGLTSDVITRELGQVHIDVTALAEHRSTSDEVQAINSLNNYQRTVTVNGPLSPDSATAILHAWTGLDYLEVSSRRTTLRMRKMRSCAMTMNSSLWHWLEIVIPNTIASLVSGSPEADCQWLANLMIKVRTQALNMTPEFTFFPFHYGLWDLCPAHAAVIKLSEFDVPALDDRAGWIIFYAAVIKQILQVWLNYPITSNSKWRGLYAINVIQTIGADFLLLDVVWHKYQNATLNLVKNVWLPEELDTSRYPLLDPSSKLCNNVKHMAELINDYIEGRLYRYVDLSSQDIPIVHYASEALREECENHTIAFKRFIQDSFRYVFRGESIRVARMEKLLREEPDKYSPFREMAPTRLNMRSRDGPFSEEALHTIPGLFSALIGRGVTFGTRFSREGRTLFASPADFHQAVSHLDESDYCDPAAYGQHNKERVPGLVDLYWEKLHQYPWPGLHAGNKLTFEELYQYFFPPSASNRRFMQLGPLGSYLLTVDYVYAGLVSVPSPDEMARIIMKLNKGPARALTNMGFVTKKSKKTSADAREQEFVDGFALAERLIRDSIPHDYHEEAGLDVFFTEHVLCKYGRMNKRCGLSK